MAYDETGVDFEEFFSSSHDLMTVAGTDGYFKVLNPAWRDVLGWESEELRSSPFMSFVHPDDVEATSVELARLTAGERTISFENRYRCRDGSYRWLQWNASPRGEVIYAIARDVTSGKDLQAALLEKQEALDAVFEASPDLILVMTPELLVQAASAAGERIHGLPVDERVGRNPLDLAHPDDRARLETALRSLLTGETAVMELRHRVRHADGHWVTVESRGRPMLDSDGSSSGAVLVSRDVSESVAAQEALHAAQAEAERANVAKSEFLSRMSHELRTPLNAVLGFAQLIELDATTDEQRESAGMILRAGRHLLALINEVLEISRIEAGALALSPEQVLLGEVLSEGLALIAPQAGQRRVELVDRDGCLGCFVRADRQRLQQVMLNLLSNAVKFNHEGGRVTVEVTAAGEERLRVSVSDTGPGIAPAALERLFVPFERLGAEEREIEGTGLGLALSLRLVEAMGGTIGVQSTPGEGSTFWIELATSDAPAAAPIEDEEGDAGPMRVLDSTGTLLYIEDNLSNLRLLERILQRRPGIRLLTAAQGITGLELAADQQPDLVLLDLHLPDLPGHQVLARLRSDPRTKAIPVTILSADASPGQIRRLQEAGAHDYLTKPIDVGQLLGLLDQFFAPPPP